MFAVGNDEYLITSYSKKMDEITLYLSVSHYSHHVGTTLTTGYHMASGKFWYKSQDRAIVGMLLVDYKLLYTRDTCSLSSFLSSTVQGT